MSKIPARLIPVELLQEYTIPKNESNIVTNKKTGENYIFVRQRTITTHRYDDFWTYESADLFRIESENDSHYTINNDVVDMSIQNLEEFSHKNVNVNMKHVLLWESLNRANQIVRNTESRREMRRDDVRRERIIRKKIFAICNKTGIKDWRKLARCLNPYIDMANLTKDKHLYHLINLLETYLKGKMRSEFKISMANQVLKWCLNDENKYLTALSPKQQGYLIPAPGWLYAAKNRY